MPFRFVSAALVLAAVAHAQSLEPLNKELPSWITLGGEYRMRYEGFLNRSYIPGNTDHHLLSRLRFNMSLRPVHGIEFVFQTQDSRVFFSSTLSPAPPYQNTFDLRLAYLQAGDPEKGRASLRFGRQEITVGDERLLGVSNWGNTARSFDAVRAYWRPVPKARFDVFAASVVAQVDGRFDHHIQGDNIHGTIGQIDWRSLHFEPFGLWRLAPRVKSESGRFGKLDSKTYGVRVTGKHGKRTESVMEWIGQNGSWGPDVVAAWATHWMIVRTISDNWHIPRLRFEYDYATGDSNPTDNRHNTFELLYPTPHDKLGLADQVGWKNVYHLGVTGEWLPNKRWTFQLRFHDWWLAAARDGVYNASGTLISRDLTGKSGRHVGEEADLQVLGSLSKQVKVGGGLGHIFPGEFLQRTTPGRSYTFPYFMMTWAF